MEYKPPKDLPPESINNSEKQPIKSFFRLLFGAGVILLALYASLYVLGYGLSKVISFKTEVRLFSSVFKSHTGGSENTKYTELLNSLWQGVHPDKDVSLTAKLIPGAVNAFIVPGGTVSVTSKLLAQTKSENELSFVLCHELGHFYHRHGLSALFTNVLYGVFNYLVGGNYTGGLPSLTLLATQSSFSQSQETRADEFAVECMNKKYGHVKAYGEFLKKMSKKEFVFQKLYFRSHPLSKDRYQNLNSYIQKKKYSLEGELVPLDKSQ